MMEACQGSAESAGGEGVLGGVEDSDDGVHSAVELKVG